VNVIIDTNILVRFLVGDDEQQQKAAVRLFREADSIIIPTLVFCESVWVLRSRYKNAPRDIAAQIDGIVESHKIVVADDEVRAGLDMMEAGGDFADGVVAYTGRSLALNGTAVFASFDQAAVRLLSQCGFSAFVPD
jgi:predicted nucleic-acid-binding protein